MKSVQHTVEIQGAVHEVFAAWCEFEHYPRFMETIREVRVLDPERLEWTADVHGELVKWESVITVNIPDRRLAWRIIDGEAASGAVTTEEHGAATQLSLQFTYSPEAPWAGLGEAETKALSVRALERFKELFESGALRLPGSADVTEDP